MTDHDLAEPYGPSTWQDRAADALIAAERPVVALEFLRERGALELASSELLRRLFTDLRAHGYLRRALDVAEALDAREGVLTTSGNLLRAEIAVLEGSADLHVPLPDHFESRIGRVLNVVGSSINEVESSYTRRTQTLAEHGPRIGVHIDVVTQMGVGDEEGYAVVERRSVDYRRIPGPSRGSVSLRDWMQLFATRLANVVRKVRPAAIVASSDFINGVAARAVARAYGLPFIMDVRGFWEDSWLQRKQDAFSWTSLEMPKQWGYPDVWRLRREREVDLAKSADAVVALSGDLRDSLIEMGVSPDRVTLVESPEEDGVEWVRVLERLGAVETGSSTIADLVRGGFSPELASSILHSDRARLDHVAVMGGKGSVEETSRDGWKVGALPAIRLTSPFNWIEACRDHRSQGFLLHAWDFMVPFLVAWDRDGDRDALEWCLTRAAEWSRTFNDGDARGTMAFYDMAIGMRAPRLAYLLQEAIHEEADGEIVDALGAACLRTLQAISAPAAFNGKTNHGFYTAVGQLAFAKRLPSLPGVDILADQGNRRLREVVATQFASDGGHLEHSPDYHRMLLFSFVDAMEDGLLSDPEVSERIDRAADVLGWFIQPDRHLVQIGDSPSRDMKRTTATTSPHTDFLASDGSFGTPNDREILVLRESGYAFVRSPQPTSSDEIPGASYVSFAGSFHSRTHKHCDDLSVTWFDDGRELLIDSGRFGYLEQLPADSPQREEGFFYGRPERQYVERARAHNTVQADRREPERRRAPYGSAILSGESESGLFRLIGGVNHGHWSHRRTIVLKPKEWMLVEDELVGLDGADHDFEAWWNLPEEVGEATVKGTEVAFAAAGHRSLHVSALIDATLIAPARGQMEPLRGWRSKVDDDFTPAWSLGYRLDSRSSGRLQTLLSLDRVRARSDVMEEVVAAFGGIGT